MAGQRERHCPATAHNLRRLARLRRLDIDDHAMIGVDQVVIGIGEEGVSLVCAIWAQSFAIASELASCSLLGVASGQVVMPGNIEANYAASMLEWARQTFDGRMAYSAVTTDTVAPLASARTTAP